MSVKHHLIILVAPLDWGLGHSARCIPIIKHLVSVGCTVLIASEGKPYTLLKTEFPNLLFLSLRGYKVQYSGSKRFLPVKILCQLPKILKAIKEENLWLMETNEKFKIDGVISDNRFGLWHHKTSSIFLTHQLQIKGPYKWIERWLLRWNYQQVNKFARCWVPDFQTEPNLAGSLSHPATLPTIPIRYIGPLSRLTKTSEETVENDILVLLSGPEPQRTLLENILLKQLQAYSGKVLLVRGLPGETHTLPTFNNVTIVNHLSAENMSQAFMQSRMIVCRSGYTTVMDVVKLRRKSIMIPTPGQTEQEYLARHLQEQKITITFEQEIFKLSKALEMADAFDYQLPDVEMDNYKPAVDEWLAEIRASKIARSI